MNLTDSEMTRVFLYTYLQIIEKEMSVCKLKDQLLHLKTQIENCCGVLNKSKHPRK